MIFVSVCPTGYKVLLKRVLTVSPAFVSQIANKNAIQSGDTAIRQVRKNCC